MTSRVRKWSGVRGRWSKEEVYPGDGPELLQAFLTPAGADLTIDFDSSGYYDPGSMYGGAHQTGWPPEGDDERKLIKASLVDENLKPVELPRDVQQACFDHWEEEIYKVEIDTAS